MWELCDSKEKVFTIMQAFVLGAYVALVDMIIKFLSSPAGATRIGATGMDVNEMATIIAFAIPISWYLFLRQQKGVFAWVNMLYIPLSLFGVILTASRGGLLVACAALLIIPMTLLNLQQKSRYVISMILVLIIVSGVIYLPDLYPKLEANVERLQGTSAEVREGTLTGRTVIWKAGLDVYKNHPIIGVGATGFRYAIMGTTVDVTTGARSDFFYNPRAPHNSFLSVLVDTGLIGFIIFIAVFGVAIIPVLYSGPIDMKFYSVLYITLILGLIPITWEADKVTWYILALFPLHSAFVVRQMKLKIIKR